MQIRLSVVAPGRAAVDAVLDAPEGSVLADAMAGLAGLVGVDRGTTLVHCGGSLIPPDHPIGSPPLLDGAVVGLGRPMGLPPRPGRRQLRVVAGPDAGAVHSLRPGRVTVGRGRHVDVRIDDPDLSRRHLVLTLSGGSATLTDCGSTNGTVAGRAAAGRKGDLRKHVGPAAAALPTGQQVECGSSRVEYVEVDEPPAALRPDGQGGLGLHRPPRVLPGRIRTEIVVPAAPDRTRTRFPWLLVVLPLLLGGVLWAVTGGNRTYLLMTVLSPLMLVAGTAGEVLSGRRGRRHDAADHAARRADAHRARDGAVAAELAHRRAGSPDPAEVLMMAVGPGQRLWERRRDDHDALRVRLGTGDLPSDVVVRDGPGGEPSCPVLDGAALDVSLPEAGVLGLAGPPAARDGLARWVVGQLVALHPPGDLRVVLLSGQDESARWSWLRWLPHLVPGGAGVAGSCSLLVGTDDEQVATRVAELTALIERRGDPTAPRTWAGQWTVVVLADAPRLRPSPEVARLLAEGPAAGIVAVCLADSPGGLPEECGAVARLVPGSAEVEVAVAGVRPVTGIADGVGAGWALRLSRALAPLRDLTPDEGTARLPAAARLVDLLGGPLHVDHLADRWRSTGTSTSTTLGVGTEGPISVDLRRDGPHALIAGTTGAGKSELLRTLIAGLAAGSPPDALTFILVDYKGGAAFAECAELPHTVGLVTDLDPHLTRRALTSLGAELRRRERVLAGVAAKDLEEYERRRGAEGLPALARLVLVIDEFATLAAELPDFVDGLVDVARRGRSLGVHLVLATQRPAGVVSAEIRANAALRIGLRMTDAGDSRDILDAPDAASIPPSVPGRAVARLADGRLTALQVARVGGEPPRPVRSATTVRPLRWDSVGAPSATDADEDPPAVEVAAGPPVDAAGRTSGTTDLGQIAAAARAAARLLGIEAPPSPWLPPLPDRVVLDGLEAPADVLPLGLLDRPDLQRRDTYGLDLAGGHLLVAGGPRSGRTTVLRSIASTLAARYPPTDAHVYVLDCAGGGLVGVEALPHCGAAVARADTDRGERLLRRLGDEVARRLEQLAGLGLGSAVEQRAAVPEQERLPWMVLLVDSWEGFAEAYETVDHGRPVDELTRLLRDGPAAGLRVVLTGDRGLLTARAAALVPGRLVLRLADPADFVLAGIAPRDVPSHLPPGRALVPGDPSREVQLAFVPPPVPGSTAVPGPAGACTLPGVEADVLGTALPSTATAPVDGTRTPLRVCALPTLVSRRDIVVPPGYGPLWTLVGVGGDQLEPAGLDLGVGGPGALVAGPPGSGRSTALLAAACWHLERGTAVVVVAPRPSPLRALAGRPGAETVLGADATELGGALRRVGAAPAVVLVDDVEHLLDTELDAALGAVLADAPERGRGLLVAGTTEELLATFRGVAVPIRRSRTGLLLCPAGPLDGDLLGVRTVRGLHTRPGRGVLAVRGRATPVQVATASPDTTTPHGHTTPPGHATPLDLGRRADG